MRGSTLIAVLATAAFMLVGCSGGSGGSTSAGGAVSSLNSASSTVLTQEDVQQVIAQAVGEAQARSKPAVIAVTDRVGNVLAVYAMSGAPGVAKIPDGPGLASGLANSGLQGVSVPAAAAAIAKAITGAYLSSSGNAFSTRTASMIVQQNFPPSPAATGLESGPLFGVQFSSLPCSDLARRYSAAGGAGGLIGPKRSPLGLSADPGGFPLYKNGVVVGGVGVLADGVYGFDPDVSDVDLDMDEIIALAATVGFEAPSAITADKISAGGTLLRYSDATASQLASRSSSVASFKSLSASVGGLTPVAGFYGGGILGGQGFGSEGSGVRPATAAEFSVQGAYVLSDGAGANRYPPSAGADGADVARPLTASETRALLEAAMAVTAHTRAAIRQPLNSPAQVSISVVDTFGSVLGIVTTADAPVFGIDVSLQKARSAMFLSAPHAYSDLTGNLAPDGSRGETAGYADATRSFLSDPTALSGKIAYSARSIGNLARPTYPDGEVGQPNGPFSVPASRFSPFATGLQSSLIAANLRRLLSGAGDDNRCTFLPDVGGGIAQNRLQNGLQIFPGGFPIYRGTTLVGAIGVSGDGVDQDDLIAFMGLYNASKQLGTLNLPPATLRADQLVVNNVRPRFVNCPVAPYLDTSQQNVCLGL
jgi:uncharacterized protein GlcG (DUF336 family)